MVFKAIRKAFGAVRRDKILYYPGCMTEQALPKIFSAYKSLLSDAGINYVMLKEFTCCGSPLLSAGYLEDFEHVKKKNLEILKKAKITKIITNCPHCYDVLLRKYGLNVQHITSILYKNIRHVKNSRDESASYHDPCLLSHKNCLIKEPRDVLSKAGYKLNEASMCKEKSFCCGAGGGLKQYDPKTSNKVAKSRLSHFSSNKIIVSCPYCYAHLKENALGSSKEIVELSEAIFEE